MVRPLLFAMVVVAGAGLASASPGAWPLAQDPEAEEQGRAAAAGVEVMAAADMWVGWPRELTEVIPLLVTIENTADVPVRLRYQEFQLVPPAGEVRQALPPFEIPGDETAVVGTAGVAPAPYPFTISEFYVAPHLAPLYPQLSPFAGPFVYDPLFYSTYYPVVREVPLPTQDMVARALPEGVLQPGGIVRGFLYFQDGDPVSDIATFVMEVVNAETGRMLGTAEIPLEID